MTPPVLFTDRLILAAHTTSDYEDSLALWSSQEVARFIGGRPSTPAEVWARLLRYGGLWPLLGYGYWVVRTRAGGFVGEVGLADFHRDLGVRFDASPEVGWALHPSAWGQGYAREALDAVLRWSDQTLIAPQTVCMISPENSRSQSLASKLGYEAYQTAEFNASSVDLFERPRRYQRSAE